MAGSRLRDGLGRRPTLDLVVVLALTVLAWVSILVGDGWLSPLRAVLVGTLLLFLPGYAALLALFPGTLLGAEERSWRRWTPAVGTGRGPAFDTAAGTVVAVGVSFACSVTTGFVLNWTPWGITTASVTAGVSAVTLLFVGLAWHRASRLARFVADPLAAFDAATAPTSGLRVVVSLVLAICLVGGFIGVVLTVPAGGESLTELGIASETGEYPMVVDDNGTVRLTLSNQEGRPVDYVVRSTTTWRPDGVPNATSHQRWRYTLRDGETARFRHTVRPPDGAANGTVVVRVYRDDTSGDPTAGNAYRTVSLGLQVRGNGTAA